MIYPRLRTLIVACGVAAVLLAAPGEAKACTLLDNLFGGLFGGGSHTTYRAVCPTPACPPTTIPSPCASCPAPCASCPSPAPSYVPQTTFRPVFRSVPVESYLPMVSCNPRTGYRVTTYRPATTWTRQTTLIPYATYRAVYTNPCNPCRGYVSYGSTTVGSSCNGCSVGAVGSPAVSDGGPAAATGGTRGSASTKTFQETQKPPVEDEEELKPIPNGTDGGADTGTGPDLGKPISRTTSLPVVRAMYYRSTASQAPPATAEPDSIIGVWRASRD